MCATKREVGRGCDGGYVTTRDVQSHGVVTACFCWEVSVPGGELCLCLFVFISKHSNTFSCTSLSLYLANICIPHDDGDARSLLFTGPFFSSFVF